MGWGPDNPKHKLGITFANKISKGDVILIARRFKGNPDIVGYGVVSSDETVKVLKGFSAPDSKWRDGTIRKLSRFVFDPAIPARLSIMSAVNHPQSLCELHPRWRPEHRKICDWLTKELRLPTGEPTQRERAPRPRPTSAISLSRVLDPKQMDYITRNSAEVSVARKREASLVVGYRDWLKKKGHDVWVANYQGLRCDAYEKKRNNLIEAKSSAGREYIRMAVGQLYDYAFLGKKEFGTPHMAILLPTKPALELLTWLDSLKIKVVWTHGKSFEDNAGGKFT